MEKSQLDPQIADAIPRALSERAVPEPPKEYATLPISPNKARESDTAAIEAEKIPDIVFETVNRLIRSRMSGEGIATVLQKDIVTALVASGLDQEEIFAKEWLVIDGYYRGQGWRVEYDRPGWNEDYPAYFKFEAPAIYRYRRLGSIAGSLYSIEPHTDGEGREIIRPIGPPEAVRQIEDNIPDAVFDTINRLIQENISNHNAIILQADIVDALVDAGLDRKEIFKQRWLNVEDIYKAMGWHVTYDNQHSAHSLRKDDDHRPHYFEFQTT
jgi:hypothetical protein